MQKDIFRERGIKPLQASSQAKRGVKKRLILFLVIIGMGLLLHHIRQQDRPIVQLIDMTASLLHQPLQAFSFLASTWRQNKALAQENLWLRHQIESLMSWQNAAIELEKENHALKELLDFQPDATQKWQTARIIARTSSSMAKNLIIHIGRKHGITKGAIVVNAGGLLGRVIQANDQTARVLMLTDPQMRVPIKTQTSGNDGIMRGQNTPYPSMRFLSGTTEPKHGERIVTSGKGGVFPPGILIGRLKKHDDTLLVELAYRRASTLFVRVLPYRPLQLHFAEP